MRAPRVIALAAAVATVALLAPIGTATATHDPAGAISCTVNSYGVKSPSELGGASRGSGFFGSVNVVGTPLTSTMVCKGSINGTAQVTGDFTWCEQSTDHNPDTNPSVQWRSANHNHTSWAQAQSHNGTTNHGPAHQRPTKFNCNGAAAQAVPDQEPLYPGDAPVNVHIVASATLTPGLVWNDVAGNPAPGPCSVTLEGHAIVPTKLNARVSCGSSNHTYDGTVEATFVPVVAQAADQFTHPSDPSQNPQTCAQWGPNNPNCFRALIFQGNLSAWKLP